MHFLVRPTLPLQVPHLLERLQARLTQLAHWLTHKTTDPDSYFCALLFLRAPVSMYESKLYSAFLGPSSRPLAIRASVTRLRNSFLKEGSLFSWALSASRADFGGGVQERQ